MAEVAMSNKTQKKASKTQNFFANEVCYGLAIGSQMGLTHTQLIEFIKEDLIEWSKKALPKGK